MRLSGALLLSFALMELVYCSLTRDLLRFKSLLLLEIVQAGDYFRFDPPYSSKGRK